MLLSFYWLSNQDGVKLLFQVAIFSGHMEKTVTKSKETIMQREETNKNMTWRGRQSVKDLKLSIQLALKASFLDFLVK